MPTPGPNLVSAETLARRKRIPDNLFAEVLKWLPVPTADFVVTRQRPGAHREEFLLALRTEEPFKGQWFIPGGRINYGETVLNAIARQALRELDLDVHDRSVVHHVEFIGPFDVLNPPSIGDTKRPEWHSIWMLHQIRVHYDAVITPHAENAEVQWFSEIPANCPEPVKIALRHMRFPPERV